MEFYVGQVQSNVDESKSGELLVSFPKKFDNQPQPVTYTSPFCKANAGGFVAIPDKGDQIIALYNDNPAQGESPFYYISTVIRDSIEANGELNPDYKALRSNDPKADIYGSADKPTTQTFTNTAGAGIYIQREFTASRISNNVTLKAESGEEVNVGSIGIQITNSEGDSVVLNGSEPNDAYAARSLMVNTRGPQEYKCTSSDINMRIIDGGDINIENNSTGLMSLGRWFGNIRLKSRFRNIDLAALGPTSHVNIYTLGATIQVDATGNVKVLTAGSIDFNAALDINMIAGGNVNIAGGIGARFGTVTGVTELNGPTTLINGIAHVTNSTPITPVPAAPAPPPVITPNDYLDPGGSV
jgi:hypothetical protein